MMLSIIVNSVILTQEHYELAPDTIKHIDKANLICSFIFLMEVVIRVIGIGWPIFFSYKSNVFDFVIAITCFGELLMNGVEMEEGAQELFETLRVFRVFKLAQIWGGLSSIITALSKSIVETFHFCIVLYIFMLIFTVMGQELFAHKLRLDHEGNVVPYEPESGGRVPPYNFDSF